MGAPQLDEAGGIRGAGARRWLGRVSRRFARAHAPGGRRPERQLGGLEAEGVEAEATTELALVAASAAERLAEKDFAALDESELLALRALMARLSLATPKRLSRRSRRERHGNRLDLRATLRTSTRTGGDPVPSRSTGDASQVPRRLGWSCCRHLGRFDRALRARVPARFFTDAVGGADAEAFVFAPPA